MSRYCSGMRWHLLRNILQALNRRSTRSLLARQAIQFIYKLYLTWNPSCPTLIQQRSDIATYLLSEIQAEKIFFSILPPSQSLSLCNVMFSCNEASSLCLAMIFAMRVQRSRACSCARACTCCHVGCGNISVSIRIIS